VVDLEGERDRGRGREGERERGKTTERYSTMIRKIICQHCVFSQCCREMPFIETKQKILNKKVYV